MSTSLSRAVRFVPPQRRRAALMAYILMGFAFGAMNRPLSAYVRSKGIHPGLVTAANVNLVLPAFAIGLAFYFPKQRTAIAGGLLLGTCFCLGMFVVADPLFWKWKAGAILRQVEPVMAAASVFYALFGLAAARFAQRRRQVGLPDCEQRCEACDYLLIGTSSNRCPECGRVRDPLPPKHPSEG